MSTDGCRRDPTRSIGRRREDYLRARLAAIVTSATDAIIGFSLDSTITDWNPAAERLFGYAAAEAVGQPLTLLIPPEVLTTAEAILARVHHGTRVEDLELVLLTQDGRRFPGALTVSPAWDETGTIIAASAIIRDISQRKAMEAELAATHQRLREVLERISDAVYALDRAWRFTYLNPAAEQFMDCSQAELLGVVIWDAFPALVDTPLFAAYHRALVEQRSVSLEFSDARSERWYEGQIYPAADGLSVVFHEITERRRLEEELQASEAKYRTLVELLPALVYTVAANDVQTPRYVSPYLEQLTGYLPEEVLGRTASWMEAVHPDDRARVATEDARALATHELLRVEYRYRRKDGSYVWVLDRSVPIRDEHGALVAFSGVLIDISDRIAAEAALAEALTAAQAATRSKSLFLAMMSHELRTPLQAIFGYADFLLTGRGGSLTPDQAEDLGYIHAGSTRMIALIDQLLDLSRMEAGNLALAREAVDLADLLRRVRQDVVPQATSKGLVVNLELGAALPTLLADPGRLYQILLNLVGNAVKFTDRGGVSITASTDGNEVTVVVSDTGIGIAPEALSVIFEEFHQGDGTAGRRVGGIGLGLAIARRLADQMGGTISVESALQVGSTFTLRLPAALGDGASTGGKSVRPS